MNRTKSLEIKSADTEDLLPRVQGSQVKTALLNRNLKSAEEIAEHYRIPVEAAKRLLSEPGFLLDLKNVEKNALRVQFYLSGCARLMKIIETDKPRTAIMAFKVLSAVLGEVEGKPLVNIENNTQNNHFEGMLAEAERLRKERWRIQADHIRESVSENETLEEETDE